MTMPANISDNICQTILIRITLLQHKRVTKSQMPNSYCLYCICFLLQLKTLNISATLLIVWTVWEHCNKALTHWIWTNITDKTFKIIRLQFKQCSKVSASLLIITSTELSKVCIRNNIVNEMKKINSVHSKATSYWKEYGYDYRCPYRYGVNTNACNTVVRGQTVTQTTLVTILWQLLHTLTTQFTCVRPAGNDVRRLTLFLCSTADIDQEPSTTVAPPTISANTRNIRMCCTKQSCPSQF